MDAHMDKHYVLQLVFAAAVLACAGIVGIVSLAVVAVEASVVVVAAADAAAAVVVRQGPDSE